MSDKTSKPEGKIALPERTSAPATTANVVTRLLLAPFNAVGALYLGAIGVIARSANFFEHMFKYFSEGAGAANKVNSKNDVADKIFGAAKDTVAHGPVPVIGKALESEGLEKYDTGLPSTQQVADMLPEARATFDDEENQFAENNFTDRIAAQRKAKKEAESANTGCYIA